MFFDSNHAIHINLIPVTRFLCPLVCQSISLTKYHFFCQQNWKPLTFEMFWSSLNGGSFTPWKPVACHKCHDQEMSMPGARYLWVKYVLPQYISSRVQNPLATIGPHQNWHLDQCWIKSCWTWYENYLKPCWSSPQPKASQASLATLAGSRKSCRRFHETWDLSQFLIRRPKSINKSIEHGDFQQCHPTSSFKALCSR